MKHAFITAVLVAGLAAPPAIAQQSEDQQGSRQNGQSGQHGQGAMMQDSEATQQHREQMNEMRELMQRERASEDPEERTQLLAQHQKMMSDRMAAMMSGDDWAAMMERCHQNLTMMHDLIEQMAAQMEAMTAPNGIEEHHWGSPEP